MRRIIPLLVCSALLAGTTACSLMTKQTHRFPTEPKVERCVPGWAPWADTTFATANAAGTIAAAVLIAQESRDQSPCWRGLCVEASDYVMPMLLLAAASTVVHGVSAENGFSSTKCSTLETRPVASRPGSPSLPPPPPPRIVKIRSSTTSRARRTPFVVEW